MQSLKPSDLLTLCDEQGGCSSLTTPSSSKKSDVSHTREHDISHVPIYSICLNNCKERPPDSDDVLPRKLSGQEVLPKIEHYVSSPMFRIDDAIRY